MATRPRCLCLCLFLTLFYTQEDVGLFGGGVLVEGVTIRVTVSILVFPLRVRPQLCERVEDNSWQGLGDEAVRGPLGVSEAPPHLLLDCDVMNLLTS